MSNISTLLCPTHSVQYSQLRAVDQYRHIIQQPICSSLFFCSIMLLHSTLPFLRYTVSEMTIYDRHGSFCPLCFALPSLLHFTVPNVYSVITVCCAVKEYCSNGHCSVLCCGAMCSAYCIVLHAVLFEWTVVFTVLYPTPNIDFKTSKK